MKKEELEKIMKKTQKKYNRFELEEAMMDMYNITNDLSLALDEAERKAVVHMHLMRVDHMFDVFEDLTTRGKIV